MTSEAVLSEERQREILQEMLRAFGPEGENWTQGQYFWWPEEVPTDEGWPLNPWSAGMPEKFCLAGCSAFAYTKLFEHGATPSIDMADFLSEHLGLFEVIRRKHGYEGVTSWNDAPVRTFNEVRGVIETRLAELRELGVYPAGEDVGDTAVTGSA